MKDNTSLFNLRNDSFALVRSFILFYFLWLSNNALGSTIESDINHNDGYEITNNSNIQYGSLYIATEPSNAKIFVDGELKGQTPIYLDINYGKHKVKIVKDYYNEHNTTINITKPKDVLVVELSERKEKKKYFNNHHFYFYGGYNPFTPTWNFGFGMYIFKVNLECDLAGLYKNTILFNDKSLNAFNISILAGYGFNIGNRFRLTPQIGCVNQSYNSIGKDDPYYEQPKIPSSNRFTIATKLDFALCDIITLSFAPKYIFNDTFEHGAYCNLNLIIGITDLLY